MAAYSVHGDLIWTESAGEFCTMEGGYLTVDGGKIISVSQDRPSCPVIDMAGKLVIPGLSDLHLHAPQYAFAGLYMDEELLEWLEKHTFPEEAKYGDMEYADKAYSILADDLRRGATTRVSVFGTIHTDSVLLLMEKLEEAGLSGYAGKVNMDRNSPDILREETEESIRETERFLRAAASFREIRPIITPRFIPSCSDELMEALGRIVLRDSLPVQTHLDENLSEVEWVRELCPFSSSYADAYKYFHMLGETPAIMAHCVWPDESEMEMMRDGGVFVAHAPSSNTNLASGIAPVRKFMEKGINVGLATDVAGGSSLSMFQMIHDAVSVSKLRWRLVDSSEKPLLFSEAFYLASKGGGAFFGRTGSFEPGYDADIVVIDDSRCRTVLHDQLSPAERLEFYTYRHPDEFVTAKFVKGRRLF